MTAKLGICVLLVALLALSTGCRTPQPNLKPEKTVEQLVAPPPGTYMRSTLPKQAFSPPEDPGRFALDPKSPGAMPTRGSMSGGPGMSAR